MAYSGVDFVETIHHETYPAISPAKADLSGKVVVINGSSRGIGRATAISFAKAGASGIVITARSDLTSLKEELLAAAKSANRPEPRILSLKVDAVDRAAVENASKEVARTFEKVDILINNAGFLETIKPLDESDPDEWWRAWEVNVKGVYLMDKYFMPLILKSELKTIVVVNSIGAHTTRVGLSAYGTTKLAVLRLNDCLTAEYKEQGLLVYGIHPRAVKTELSSALAQTSPETFIDTPELTSDALVWLTKEKREWLANRYISVNWDVEELMAKKDAIVAGDLLEVRLRV